MKIVHISDTHGKTDFLSIPQCDILVHTGDVGGRTDIKELTHFLIWFEQQPAQLKVFIAGNHDLVLDKHYPQKEKDRGNVFGWTRMLDEYKQSEELIKKYDVLYLNNSGCIYDGVNIWGSPYSPSFHREYWAFNADRGEEINKHWAKIPSDTNILLSHSPVYSLLDDVKEYAHPGEDPHVGCKDLMYVITKRLIKLKLHCSGHIHDNYGIVQERVSNSRRVLFSNGAVLNNSYEKLIDKPLIIEL